MKSEISTEVSFLDKFTHFDNREDVWNLTLRLVEKNFNFSSSESRSVLEDHKCATIIADDILHIMQKGVPLVAAIGIAIRVSEDVIRSSN